MKKCKECGTLTDRKDGFCCEDHKLDYEAFKSYLIKEAIT